MDDAQVVAQALAGSEDAYRELVERYERPVWSLVVRMVHDEAVAEELAQDAFVKAFRALDSYDPGRKFSSWLFKIAHNTTLDHLRRKNLDTVPLETDQEDDWDLKERLEDTATRSPEAEASRGDLAEALEDAVGSLRPEYREVVVLRFGEGLAYQEIVEITGLPLGTVKTYLHRARKELAGTLTAAGWGPGDVGS